MVWIAFQTRTSRPPAGQTHGFLAAGQFVSSILGMMHGVLHYLQMRTYFTGSFAVHCGDFAESRRHKILGRWDEIMCPFLEMTWPKARASWCLSITLIAIILGTTEHKQAQHVEGSIAFSRPGLGTARRGNEVKPKAQSRFTETGRQTSERTAVNITPSVISVRQRRR